MGWHRSATITQCVYFLQRGDKNTESLAPETCANVLHHKEEYYVRNGIDRRRDFAASRCTANLASQPPVGLLSEWRSWLDPLDFDHPATVRPVIMESYR